MKTDSFMEPERWAFGGAALIDKELTGAKISGSLSPGI